MKLRSGIFLILQAFLVLVTINYTDGSFATMSIDLGSQYLKMGLIKQGSTMEIVLNKESRRKTPTIIGMRNGERSFSETAAQLSLRYPKNVFMHTVDLIGKDNGHPLVEEYKKRFPHAPLVISENGSIYLTDGTNEYSSETLLAMILQNAKAEVEAYAGQPVDDVVISIPPFLTQRERISIKRAAKIAGLKVLQLLHSGSAAALSWGAFHRKEIDGKKTTMLVYDMGATHITATVVQFYTDDKKETRMKVLGTGYDRSFGGIEITRRLREYLCDKWEKETKTEKPLRDNPRGMAKLMAEAERVKQVLSANTEIVSQIESLHEDHNLRLKVTRKELEGLITDLVEKFTIPVEDALKIAGHGLEGINEIVLMGAATRMPLVQKTLQSYVKRDLGRFLNTDEAIAMGSLFQSAHLSKGFKVKVLPIEETVLFPIQARFQSINENGEVKDRQSSLFPLTSVYPSPNPRSISFKSYRNDFSFTIAYGSFDHLNEEQRSQIVESNLMNISVSDIQSAIDELKEGDEWKETKVSFAIDRSGIVRVKNAEVIINRPRGTMEALKDSITGLFTKTEEEPSSEENDEDNDKNDKENTVDDREMKKEEEKKEDEKNGEDNKEEAEEKKNDTIPIKNNPNVIVKDGIARVKLNVSRYRLDGTIIDEDDMKNTKKILEEFSRMEKAKAEREMAENELESIAFDSSLLLEEELFIKVAKNEEKDKIENLVKDIRGWLEDEANVDTETEEFKKRKRSLVKAVDVVKKRIHEKKEGPKAFKELKEMIPKAKVVIANVSERDVDIVGDLKKIVDDLEKWIAKNDKEVAENEDLLYSLLELKLKEDRIREGAKSFKRKVEKRNKDEEKKKKKEEEEKKKEEEKYKDNETKKDGDLKDEESTKETKTEL